MLHPSLYELVEEIRNTGIADRISIVTNGTLLDRIDMRLCSAVDEIEICIYPKTRVKRRLMAQVAEIASQSSCVLKTKSINVFREPYSAVRSDEHGTTRRIFSSCQIAHSWGCHQLEDGRFYKCPQAHTLSAFSRQGEHDGVDVFQSSDLFAEVRSYLESPEPLHACRHCLGSVGKKFLHTQVLRIHFEDYQKLASADLLDWDRLAELEEQGLHIGSDCAQEITVAEAIAKLEE